MFILQNMCRLTHEEPNTCYTSSFDIPGSYSSTRKYLLMRATEFANECNCARMQNLQSCRIPAKARVACVKIAAFFSLLVLLCTAGDLTDGWYPHPTVDYPGSGAFTAKYNLVEDTKPRPKCDW